MKRKSNKLPMGKAVFVVLLLTLCVFLTTGNSIVSGAALYAADGEVASGINVPDADKTSTGTQNVAIESWEEYAASRLPLIASIPEKDIYLYGIKPSGAILYVKGTGHYFGWEYITPRFVLPRMHVGDFDSDGKEELAVILYIGSGTGFAVEELHIVEIAEEEVLSNKDYFVPNPQYFKDHYYQPKAYVDKLVESVTLKSYHKQNELMLDIGINGEITTINLRSLQSIKKEIAIDDMACFGDIVVFNFNNGKLTAQFVMGVTSEAFAAPYPIGEVYADVNYSQNRFVLSNLHFKQDEGI